MTEEFKSLFKEKVKHKSERSIAVLKWTICSILTGLIVGGFSTAFGLALGFVIKTRETHSWLIFLLPFGALLIVAMYKLILKEKDGGTNVVISAIQTNQKLPLRMAPLIFISTLITHLVGGSAGREGAALQMGGSIGNYIGHIFKFNDADRKTLIMCGMSAAFSALFGTPMASAIFSLEVISIGIMHYSALVPCVISSLVARYIAAHFGLGAMAFVLTDIPKFTLKNAIIISIFAIICGLVSTVFCMMLHISSKYLAVLIHNPYMKAFVGGTSVLLLTLIVGNNNYNSTGSAVIASCFTGATITLSAFILKMIFTTLTLSCGYKGGEIVPTLFIGATLGAAIGQLIGFHPALLAAVGMGALFCGVTNCPITSLLICFELFGYDAMPYYLLAIPFAYWVSGYHGLYSSQKIVYSKYKSNYIDKNVK